jgi:sodium transport system ATP-binding protein
MISVKNVSKEYKLSRKQQKEYGKEYRGINKIIAVDNVSFECQSGRIYGLIGPNGAGKTTILRMIATMLKPSSGSIEVCGFGTVKESQKVRKNIGFMTGQTALYDRLTPNEMVKYIADLNGMDKRQFKTAKEKIFDSLKINDFANRRIGKLSTGMKQKTSIARTIITNAPVLVFDEPTEGLDIMTSRAIIDLIRSAKDDRKTVIFSTHRMGEVKLLCDDIGIIHNGKMYFNGTLSAFESQMTKPSFEDEFIHLVGWIS